MYENYFFQNLMEETTFEVAFFLSIIFLNYYFGVSLKAHNTIHIFLMY